MEDLRSKSYRDGRMQIESYYGGGGRNPNSMQDLRSYSANDAGSEMKSSSSKKWSLMSDPELQRKKRVAGYRVYSVHVQGNMKGSFRKSFRWIKDTCNHAVHGWW